MCWTSEPKNRHTHTHIHKICIYYQHAFKTQFKGWICWNKHVINRAIILKSKQPKQSSRWSRRNTRSFLITCEHKDPIPAQRNILKRSKTFVFASFFIVLSRTIFTYRKKNTQQKLGHHIIFDATNLIGIWIKMQKSWFENWVKVFRSQKFQFNSCHAGEKEKKGRRISRCMHFRRQSDRKQFAIKLPHINREFSWDSLCVCIGKNSMTKYSELKKKILKRKQSYK